MLKELKEGFCDFSSFELCIILPHSPLNDKTKENFQMELIEMQSDSTFRAKYLEVGIPGFFSYLPEISESLQRELCPCSVPLLCVSSYFPSGKQTWFRLTDEHLLHLSKVGTANIFQTDIWKIVMKRRHETTGQTTKDDWTVLHKCSITTVKFDVV